jgi:hypothetical protein
MAFSEPLSSKLVFFQKFLHPSWLAGIISVGFHGVLFAAGPTFPSLGFNDLVEPELEAERRNVPLVELSAAEQARLPDFSRPFYDFNNFDDLEPLSPLFNGDELPSPGKTDSSPGSIPSPFNRRQPTPTPSYRIPFGITHLESRPRTRIPSSPSSDAATESDEGKNSTATTDGEATPRRQGTAADLESATANSDPTTTPEDTDVAAGSNPTEVMTLEERLQAYAYDGTDTELEEAETRFDDWLAVGETWAEELDMEEDFAPTRGLQLGTAATQPSDGETTDGDTADDERENTIVQAPIELPIDYEQGICLTKDPQKGLIGAWVSPAGELLGEPEVIRSTGYAGINQQAIRYIETLDFSSVTSFTGYQFEVVVNYNPEGCINMGHLLETGDRPTPADTNHTDPTPNPDDNEAATTPSDDASPPAAAGESDDEDEDAEAVEPNQPPEAESSDSNEESAPAEKNS